MKLPPEMVKLAQHIIRTKSGEFDPSLLEDHYRNALVRIRRNILPVAPRTERALLTAATYGSERRSYWRSPKLDYFGRNERRRVLNEKKFWSVHLLFDVLVKVVPKSLGTHRHEDNTRSEIYGLESVAHHCSSAYHIPE
jgi:hypothetical protein